MKNNLMIKVKVLMFVFVGLSYFPAESAWTQISAKISSVSNGWGEEGMTLILKEASTTAPTAACGNANYVLISANRADYNTMAALSLTGYVMDSSITVTVEGCTGYRATVIGMQIN